MRAWWLATVLPVFLAFVPGTLRAESLFEQAQSISPDLTGAAGISPGLRLSGYLKGAVFAGRNDAAEPVVQGSYGELDLKGNVEAGGLGRALVDLRFTAGENRGPEEGSIPTIREAWVETEAGPVSVRLGRQIIVWGRADAINPTNVITPMDDVLLSSDVDDLRMGNELLHVTAKLTRELGLTGIWVPRYRADILPIAMVDLPDEVTVETPVYPDDTIASSSWAFRLEMITGPIDGSVSYARVYDTLPGFNYALTPGGIRLTPTAYRMQMVGADFSTSLWDFGLRGEASLKMPDLSENDAAYVPATHVQVVAGLDRTFGDWNVLVQYSGTVVPDFHALTEPVLTNPLDPLAQMQYAAEVAANEMVHLNRLFTGTTERVSHAVTAQVGWSGLAETLRVTLAGLYNFTTRDVVINPSVAYDIADALTVTVGARDVDGPSDSLNRLVNRLMSSAYVELKSSF